MNVLSDVYSQQVETTPTKRSTKTNADRWATNDPTGPALRRSRFLGVAFFAVAVVVSLCLGAAVALGQEGLPGAIDDRPVLYYFSADNCGPCNLLAHELFDDAGKLRTYANIYRIQKINLSLRTSANDAARARFVKRVRVKQRVLDFSGTGIKYDRPDVNDVHVAPILWVEDRPDYWQGFNRVQINDLSYYLQESIPVKPISTPQPFFPEQQPATVPNNVDLGTPAPSPPVQTPQPQAEPPAESIEPPPATTQAPQEDFSGVTLVVLVASLTEGAEPLRAELARRANAALQQLARKHVGDKVQTYLVSEVGDRELYERLVETVGVRPGVGTQRKVAALVLLPERFDGLSGFIVKQAETALANHYLPDLKKVGVMPIVERIHGDTYNAVLAALTDYDGGNDPNSGPFVYLVATYLAERSKLAELIARRLGMVA